MGQVIGIVRIDAHARRIAIEGMTVFGSAVGFATPQLPTRLDHQQAPASGATQQLRRQQGAAQATPDDQYIRHVVAGRCRLLFVHRYLLSRETG